MGAMSVENSSHGKIPPIFSGLQGQGRIGIMTLATSLGCYGAVQLSPNTVQNLPLNVPLKEQAHE